MLSHACSFSPMHLLSHVWIVSLTYALSCAVCRNVLLWVASKFSHIDIYDDRYVNRNKCVYKEKCILDIGKCMEAKVNHLYEQNKHISTGAVADREKGHTSGDMATCLCSCCTIVYGQVQKSRESGCDEALALEMYTAAVVAKVHGEEDKCELVEQSISLSQGGNEDQIQID